MAKISNKDIYQDIDSISLLDYLIGTKKNGKGTKSFPLESVIQLINSTNGVNNIQFQFSNGLDPNKNYTTAGQFFTNTNSGNVANFSQLIFNKETRFPIDLTLLFKKLGATQNVVFTLKNPEDPNNFIKLKVVSFTDNITHFTFGVQPYEDLFIGGLVNEKIYSLYFDVIKSSEADRFTAIGTSTLVNNSLSVSVGYAWLINGSNYANTIPFNFVIPLATVAKKRIDVFVVNRLNNILRIQGVESVGNPVKPNIPQNTLELTFVLVSDGLISDPNPPIVGDAFIEKSLQEVFAIVESGILNNYVLPPNYNFEFQGSLSGAVTQVNSFNLISGSSNFQGKRLTFKNKQISDIIFSNIGFNLVGNGNVLLKPNESIEFYINDDSGFDQIGIDVLSRHPYNVFKFVQKGFGNTGPQIPPEANDVYCGHLDDGSQYCPVAYYRGSGTLTTHLSFKIPFTVGKDELTF